jgi:hypothetical protein
VLFGTNPKVVAKVPDCRIAGRLTRRRGARPRGWQEVLHDGDQTRRELSHGVSEGTIVGAPWGSYSNSMPLLRLLDTLKESGGLHGPGGRESLHPSGNIRHPRLDYEDIDQTATRRPRSPAWKQRE